MKSLGDLYNNIRDRIESGETLSGISRDLGVSIHEVKKARAGIGRESPEDLVGDEREILTKYVRGYSTKRLNLEGYDADLVRSINVKYHDYIHDEHKAYMESLYEPIKRDLESGEYTSTEVASKYDVPYDYVREIREENEIDVYTGKLNKEDHDKILSRVRLGDTYQSIADDFGVTKQTISLIAIKHGKGRWEYLDDEEGNYLREMYESGVSVAEIVRRTGRSYTTVIDYLKSIGVYVPRSEYVKERDAEIIKRYKAGELGIDLAEEYGLRPETIYDIANHRYSK